MTRPWELVSGSGGQRSDSLVPTYAQAEVSSRTVPEQLAPPQVRRGNRDAQQCDPRIKAQERVRG
jgi:hypothetical protein